MSPAASKQSFEIEDPTTFLVNMLTFSHSKSFFPNDHWEATIIGLFGTMGSGKSEMLKYFAKIGQQIYGEFFSCYSTNDIIRLVESLETVTPVLFIFVDDAMSAGHDSRKSMSEENVKQSQHLAVIRHKLSNIRKWGFVVVFYALQDPMRLDAFVRRNLHLAIYKSWYDTLEKSVDRLNKDYLKKITRKSMYEHIYQVRSLGLAITKTNELFKIKFPRVKFEIPEKEFDSGIGKEKAALREYLLEVHASKEDMIGEALIFCEENNLDLSQKEINKMITMIRYERRKKADPDVKINKEVNRTELNRVIDLRKQGFGWREVAKMLGKAFNTVYSKYRYLMPETISTA